MRGGVVQSMVAGGVEMILGVATDPLFGPVVMAGMGGVTSDLVGDRAFVVPPIDQGRAASMVASLRTAPLLDGYRGSPVVDRMGFVNLVQRVAAIAVAFPELAELDLNPVLVRPDGVCILDCKVRLQPSPGGPGPLFRSLRARTPREDAHSTNS